MQSLLLRFAQIWRRVWNWWSRPRPLRVANVEDLPVRVEKGIIYMVGENDWIWCVAMLCPCGCKATVQLSTLADVRPCWRVTEHTDKTISLQPSVWRQVGCRSHFFVKHGLIEWCGV